MAALASPIPSISISLAPHEALPAEPYSPFDSIAFPVSEPRAHDEESPRATHLMLPMARPSPLSGGARRTAPGIGGKGLDRARFESLLKSTRERAATQQQQQQLATLRASPAVNAALDLRKQAALKAHNSKQAERRAIFLSKIEAPPSPSATDVPVTPPESPALLHYSLPSPGLESPIALFETLAMIDPSQKRMSWIEHVEFHAPKQPPSPRKPLPSLDQITARISSNNNTVGPKRVRLPIGAAAAPTPVRAPIPLPAFLRKNSLPSPTEKLSPVSPAAPARVPLPVLPTTRGPTPPPAPHPLFAERTTVLPAPPAPTPAKQGGRYVHPNSRERNRRASEFGAGAAVNEANLALLESRNEMSKAMLEKILRRVSSPAELERAGRRGGEVFGEHRVLTVPGGF